MNDTTEIPDPTTPTGSREARQLCDLLGIRHPVLLAPMAKVAGGRLAAAVSDAGGLGILGGGYGDTEWIDTEWQAAANSRIGIGLILWRLTDPPVLHQVLDAVVALEPAAIWLSFGDPTDALAMVTGAGIPAIVQIATREEADEAVASGADVIVAQGTESGGHGRPQHATLTLVSELASAELGTAGVPIVAAGGISTNADHRRALDAGASGVALGTAFYATTEAADVDGAKQRLVSAGSDDTVRGLVYDRLRGPDWPAGYDGRSLRTTLTAEWTGREHEMPDIDRMRAEYADAAAAADMDRRVVWAGEGVGGISAVTTAAEVVERIIGTVGAPDSSAG